MNKPNFKRTLIAASLAALMPITSQAASELDALRNQVAEMQKQLQALQAQLAEQQKTAAEVQKLRSEVADVAESQSEWTNTASSVHLAGFGSIGYTDNEDANGSFNRVSVSPIFHYQYKDLMMLEAELELANTADGETTLDMEYASLDLFLNDYMTLVAGKFLSPIGQFRQNYHPSWINKLPMAPPGFGHGGAAPVSETGLELRGGFPLGDMRANYAIYVSNGPVLHAADEDGVGVGDDPEIEEVAAEGMTSDPDGNKVWGGRLGLIPMPGLEIGLSAATGKVAVVQLEDTVAETVTGVTGDPARDYDVLGFDFKWGWKNLDLRGEYVQTKVAAAAGSVAGEGGKWTTWYTQAAYKFPGSNIEGVLRYGDLDSPHVNEDKTQWAFGVNYLFAPNVIAKVAYEMNSGQAGQPADKDSLMLQLAYGF